MGENDQTQIPQSTTSSAQSVESSEDLGTSSLASPGYSISSGGGDDEGGSSSQGSYVDVPFAEFNYDEVNGYCAVSPNEEAQNMTPAPPESQASPQPDARATISDIDPANLSESTFATIINGLLGGNGSSAEITLDVGLGVGGSIGVAEAFGGIKLRLGGKAEIDTTGKFKLEGMLGFGGYLRAEAAWIFEAAVERMGNIKMEGEFDSVTHFSQYVHSNIVRAAQGILRAMRAEVSDRFIPATLIQLAEASVGRVRGPEITTSTETQTTGSIAIGNEAGGVSWELGHTSADYVKERDGRQTDRGSQTVVEGSHGIRIGENEGTISFKNTTTDSQTDSNDKEEFELKIGISGVANRLDQVGSERLISLVDRTGATVNALTSMAANAGRAIVTMVSGGSLYTGRPTVPDLELGARGSLNLVFKWEKTDANFEIKSAAVNFGYSMNFEANAQFPIPGTPLMGEGSTALNAQFVRNIIYRNF